MLHYIDIQLRLDAEFPAHQLMAALYLKLHVRLTQNKTTHIGVSFPGYSDNARSLGNLLRLIGPRDELTRLMDNDWLHGMSGDHVIVRPMLAVPDGAQQRSLRRVQAKSSPERLRRRQIRRHGITEEQACERLPDAIAETLDLPFLVMPSASTGQRFRLFLHLGPTSSAAKPGVFNSYGLSRDATIPWF